MNIFGVRVKIHPLSPIMLIMMLVFTGPAKLAPVLIALSLHELAHIFACALLGMRIDELELMPFGAALRLEHLWEAPAIKLIIVSLAGPLANLLLSSACALYAHLSKGATYELVRFLEANLCLALFNLAPALPMDGGRALCGLLSFKLDRTKALKCGVWCGRAFSLLLALTAVYVFFLTRRIQLAPLLAAVYVFTSQDKEKRSFEGAALRALLLADGENLPVRRTSLCLVQADVSVYECSKYAEPGEACVYAVTDSQDAIIKFLTISELQTALLKDAAAPVGSVGRE